MPPTSTRSKLCRIFAFAGIFLLCHGFALANSAKHTSRTKHEYSLSKKYFSGGPQPNISTPLTSPVTIRPVPITINFGNSAATELINNSTNIAVSPNAILQGFSRSYQLAYASSFGSLGNGDTQFNNVLYNYVDPNGNIYISDDLNNKVKVFDVNRRLILTLGTGSDGNGDGDLNSPYGVSTDAAGRIYVVDQLNNRIQVFSSNGTLLKKFGMEGTGDGLFKEPAGIDVDASGKIYVADKGNNRIQIFDSFDHDFAFIGKIGDLPGNSNLQFNTPVDVKVADDGGIYVADLNNNRIQLFRSDLSYNRTYTSGSLIPTGISLDGLGNLIVSNDNYLTKLIVFRLTSGAVLASYSSPGNGSGTGQFNRPQSVTTDRKGNIFIADLNNNRVQQFRVLDTYSASINPISAGTITVTLNAGAVKDASGNPSSQSVFTIEYAPPALQTTLNSPLRDQSVDTAVIPVSYSVSKPADTLSAASFDITNGTITHIKDSLSVQFQSVISNGFGYPTAVTVDNSGYIYGADGATDRILVFTEDGQFIRAFGSTGQGNGNFSLPAGLAFANGLLYVADEHNNRIQIVNTEGNYVDKFGSFGIGNAQFNLPSGVFVNTLTNRIYVADQGNNRIQVFDLSNKSFVLKFGTAGSGPGQLNAPTAVTADAAGNIYVTDGNNRRIQKFDANGTYIKTLSTAGQTSAPTALTTDGAGRIYITDGNKNQLLVYTYNGTFLKAYGSGGGAFGFFNRPAGVALDKNGKIYVADQANGRIQVFAASDFYTADVIPGQDGDVVISVPANRIFDANRNGNAANVITVTYNNSAPGKPTGLAVASLDTKAALTWNSNAVADQVSFYKIFYGTTNDATAFITVPSSQTSYTSQGLINGTTYYYRISAIDVLGHESPVSDQVSVIPKANQTIAIVQTVTGKKFGDGPFDLTGVATAQPSQLQVSYTVVEGPASITGNTVTLSGAGSVKIRVEQAGNAIFNPATPVVFTFNVSKATAVIAGDDLQNKPYTGQSLSLALVLNHAEAALSYSPQQSYSDVGEHTITVSVPATNNYLAATKTFTLNIIPAEIQGIVFRDTTVIYDGTAKSINLIKPAGSNIVYNGPASYTNAGDYVIAGIVTNGPNYTPRPVRATLHILTAPLVNNFIFNGQEFEFDGNAHFLTVQNLGDANAVIPGNGKVAVGEYNLTAYITQPNYTSITKQATLKIIPPRNAGIVFPNGNFTYDGTAKYLAVANPNGSVDYEGNGQINAGTYQVKATVHRSNLADTVLFANLIINKASTEIAVSGHFTYDGTPHLPGILILNRSGVQSSLSDNTPQINAGTYNYTVSIPGDANYNPITNFPVILQINKAPSIITLNDGNFQVANYDGTAKTIHATLNRPGSTSADLIFSPAGLFINKGLYTNIQISAAATQNYEAPQPVFASLQIVSGTMAPVFRDTTFTYDGTPKKVEVVPSSIPSGVNISYDVPGNTFTNADDYSVTAHITDPNGNYLPVTATARLGINKAVFTGITFDGASFTYDGTPKSLVSPVIPAFANLNLSGNGKINVGDYDVTATVTDASAHPNYYPLSLTRTLSITPASIQNIVFKNAAFVYDGSVKSIAIDPASLPADAAVTYTGNDKVNVGDYEVSATVTQPNHQTRIFIAHITITPADITGVTFSDKIYTYDGNIKSLAAANLPPGASVDYTGNNQTAVGVYRVQAHITAPNYNPLDLYAYLNIVAATSSGMVLPDVTYTYDGTVKALEVLNRLSNTDVTYTNNNQIEPGIYEVRATVTQAGYNDVNLIGHITIVKASVTILTNSLQVTDYDGTIKNIVASVSPSNRESQLTYTPQQGYIDAGDYAITVSAPETAHYNAPQSKVVTLRIIPQASITGVTFTDHSFVYDGIAKSLLVDNLPANATVSYSNNNQTQAGSYTVTATVQQPNHQPLILTAQLNIATAPITGVIFNNGTFVYDGNPKNLSANNLPADATVTYTGNQKINAGSYTVTAQISQPNHTSLILAATLRITQAQAEIIADADQTVTFDGSFKNVVAKLNHNEAGLSFTPQQGYVDAGDYIVTVSAPATANYAAVNKQLNLHIKPASISGVTFPDGGFDYDGTVKSISVSNLPLGGSVVYSGNNQTNAGTYTVTAVITQPNHQNLTLTANLVIRTAPITGVIFADNTFIYDGTTKNLSVANIPPNSTIAYSNNGQVNAGIYTVTAKIHQDDNHSDLVLSAKLLINKAVLILTADDVTRPYNVANPVFTFSYSGFKGNDNINNSFTELPVATSEASVASPVGEYQIKVSGGSAPNYSLTYIAGTLTVKIVNRVLTFGPLVVKTYGDADFDAGATSSSGEAVIYTSSNTNVATVVNGKVHISGAGTTIITATLPANANYSNTPFISQSLVVNKANQTIALSSIPTLIRGDKYDLSVIKSSSGLPVSFITIDQSIAHVEVQNLNALHIGVTTIIASQAGDNNYNPAKDVIVPVIVKDGNGNEFIVHQALSPNGDGINDFLYIEGIQQYANNRITIIDRNGTKVYETSGYDNANKVFNGHSNITGQLLTSGTYFYLVEYINEKGEGRHKMGYFVLKY